MSGPKYGDFHLDRQWTNDEVYSLFITQDRSTACHLRLRQFEPPHEPDAVDLKGRPMYHFPYALADADETTQAVNQYLDQSIESYLDAVLDDTDSLIHNVFHFAWRMSVFPEPVSVLL